MPSPARFPSYRGRFAPSPSGPLHFGSLVAAVGSALDAWTQGGEWRVRMEDVDRPRTVAGAAGAILRTLEAFGFAWDGPVLYQSERSEAYAEALHRLLQAGMAYGCACSRREIADSALGEAVDGGLVYPGTCRGGLPPGRAPRAWRLLTDAGETAFDDRLQGRMAQRLASDVGDFVLLRADGCYAYQLAVVVDDAAQGITHVVRGADLIASTPRQLWLQACLGLPAPAYAHLPVAVNGAGEKLSKQTRARPLDRAAAPAELCRALDFLGQRPPQELASAPVAEVWAWAREHWSFAALPRQRAIRV
ncbi:MAG: tRNA glutamyl-Q(34) synthetase GluQRS [Azonexus sp.]|jgi:glutamyl-Q tRNA(Asp) synthetase|nr:tRNA glutamyl-Q(34) synthetase GluQRS [Betaproteobacteria bacterium]MBK8916645.1 tRNA glutamyl-Q(34) synthetase GluQRS [Betaproteobacteria bacterium]MBP6037215.1 tRNA glutamyl-Q(34) synthetase GluQRS [Azonexus sp.]MBP6907749.1 tRNA glutamyl-Q(34) synthetase GluQRS [Azonexus sp.]